MCVFAKFELHSFTRSRDNTGHPKKLEQSLDMLTLPFLQNFYWAFVRMDPECSLTAKFEVRSFLIQDIIAIGDLGGGCEPKSWGRRNCRRSGIVPFERALVSSRPSIVTYPLYAFQRYCRLCAPAHNFSPPHL